MSKLLYDRVKNGTEQWFRSVLSHCENGDRIVRPCGIGSAVRAVIIHSEGSTTRVENGKYKKWSQGKRIMDYSDEKTFERGRNVKDY